MRLSGGVTLPSSLILAHAPDQIPPPDFGASLIRRGLCRLLSVPAGRWPFPTLDLRVFPWMLGPVPRRSCEVHLLVSSLTTSAFPEKRERVGDHKIVRSATSERGLFSRPLSFLTFWPPSLLATPVAPTAVVDGSLASFPPAWSHVGLGLVQAVPHPPFLDLQGSRGVYVRAEHMSLPSCASNMLAVRFRAIDG